MNYMIITKRRVYIPTCKNFCVKDLKERQILHQQLKADHVVAVAHSVSKFRDCNTFCVTAKLIFQSIITQSIPDATVTLELSLW